MTQINFKEIVFTEHEIVALYHKYVGKITRLQSSQQSLKDNKVASTNEHEKLLSDIDVLRRLDLTSPAKEIVQQEIERLCSRALSFQDELKDLSSRISKIGNELEVLLALCPHPDKYVVDRIVHPHKGEELGDCTICGRIV